MYRHVLVVLLKAVVLSDVVGVISADDSGPPHLHLGHHARQDVPSDKSNQISSRFGWAQAL